MTQEINMRQLQERYGGLGSFVIQRALFLDSEPEVIQAIFFGAIVVQADWNYYVGDGIRYVAYHPDFEQHVEPGAMIPEYEAIVEKDYNDILNVDDGTFIYRVMWKLKTTRTGRSSAR